MRQVVLDTETTGIGPENGHRIIEIGCVELIDRKLTGNNYHQYLNPDREIDAEAVAVHGITNEFLDDKPRFPAIANTFWDYIKGAELIIHNAPFDVGFIDHEYSMLKSHYQALSSVCKITDSLVMARKKHPGQKNSLDALCKRYAIDNSHRTLHGALLDAEILSDVYLLLSGGQVSLGLELAAGEQDPRASSLKSSSLSSHQTPVLKADEAEQAAHERYLENLAKQSETVLWQTLN